MVIRTKYNIGQTVKIFPNYKPIVGKIESVSVHMNADSKHINYIVRYQKDGKLHRIGVTESGIELIHKSFFKKLFNL